MLETSVPASARADRPARRAAGEEWKSARCERYQWSTASEPARGNTHRSRGTPAASAAAAEHMISAPPWSTRLFPVSNLGYGNETIRLFSPMVMMSSAEHESVIQAWGLPAATWENRDHRRPMSCSCSARDRPGSARGGVLDQGRTRG